MEIGTSTSSTGLAFFQNDHTYKWEVSPGDAWIPAQSYFRIRVKLGSEDAGTLAALNSTDAGGLEKQHIAFKSIAGLFRGAKFRINGVDVCTINSNLHQIEVLNERLNRNKNQKISFELSTTKPSVNAAELAASVDVIWRPSLPIFDEPNALPCGKYEIVLTHKSYEECVTAMIEERATAPIADHGIVPRGGKGAYLDILQNNFCYMQVSGRRFDNGSILLDMNNIRAQEREVNSGSNNINIDVKPSTYALSFAWQDGRGDAQDALCASRGRFIVLPVNKAVDTRDLAGFKRRAESNIQRFQVSYAGQNYPQNSYELTQNHGWRKVYMDTILQTGQYHDAAPCESYEEWLYELGPHVTYQCAKDGYDRSTQVTCNITNALDQANSANFRMLCFDHYKSLARITISDGTVVQVEVQDQ